MGMNLMNQMQRWMRTTFLGHELAVAPVKGDVRWQPGPRSLAPVARTPITPFKTPAVAQRSAVAARRSYARVDPADRRRTVICGSPAQVCAVLEIMERAEGVQVR